MVECVGSLKDNANERRVALLGIRSCGARVGRNPGSVSRLRVITRDSLREWGLDHLVEVAALCVSELATNAVRYGDGCDISFAATFLDHLVIEVHDSGAGVPVLRRAAEDGETGRGLALVEALAVGWGWERLGGGWKRVWCELCPSVSPLGRQENEPVHVDESRECRVSVGSD